VRDEKLSSRNKREFFVRKIYASGIDVTMSVNMKIRAGKWDLKGEDKWIYRLSASQEVLERQAERMNHTLSVPLMCQQDELERGLKPVFAPFIRAAKDNFEAGVSGKFTSSERATMIYAIIENILQLDRPDDAISDAEMIPQMVEMGYFINPSLEPYMTS